MSNICSTDICFYSKNRIAIEELHEKVATCLEKGWNHTCGIRAVFDAYGYMPSNMDLRSDILCVGDIAEKEGYAYFYTAHEDAWVPKIHVMSEFLLKYFPDISLCVRADECGNGVYINTDDTGLFFPGTYLVDMCIPGRRPSECGVTYEDFNTEEELLEFLKKEYEIEANTAEEAKEIVWKLISADDEAWGGIHEYNED